MAEQLEALRVQVKAVEATRGVARLRALEELHRRVQEVADIELLATLGEMSAYDLAPQIGITPPSVYSRAKNARERLRAAEPGSRAWTANKGNRRGP